MAAVPKSGVHVVDLPSALKLLGVLRLVQGRTGV